MIRNLRFWWLKFVLKLLPKFAHQLVALTLNRTSFAPVLEFTSEKWPPGSEFSQGKYMYRGLRIAKVSPHLSRLYVTNDWPLSDWVSHKEKWWKIQGFIPLLHSRRLSYLDLYNRGSLSSESLHDKNSDNLEMRLKKMTELMNLQRVEVPVLLRQNGDFVVVNGNHRVIAIFCRDRSLENIDFYITL